MQVRVAGAAGSFKASAEILAADALDATAVTFNGTSAPAADLSDAPAKDLGAVNVPFDHTFPPYSITLIHLAPAP